MTVYFSDDEAVRLEIEIKPTCGTDGDMGFSLLQFIKHAFILQVSKSNSSLSIFFKIKYTRYIILHHERHKLIFT